MLIVRVTLAVVLVAECLIRIDGRPSTKHQQPSSNALPDSGPSKVLSIDGSLESESERLRELIIEVTRDEIAKHANDGYANLDRTKVGSQAQTAQRVTRPSLAFHRSQRSNVAIRPRGFVELKYFHAILIGSPISKQQKSRKKTDQDPPQFAAIESGSYLITANLHFSIKKKKYEQKDKPSKNKNTLRVMICVNSSCDKSRTVQYIAPMSQRSRLFSVNMTGLLKLKVGQSVSVFVENNSNQVVTVMGGSSVSGIMVE